MIDSTTTSAVTEGARLVWKNIVARSYLDPMTLKYMFIFTPEEMERLSTMTKDNKDNSMHTLQACEKEVERCQKLTGENSIAKKQLIEENKALTVKLEASEKEVKGTPSDILSVHRILEKYSDNGYLMNHNVDRLIPLIRRIFFPTL